MFAAFAGGDAKDQFFHRVDARLVWSYNQREEARHAPLRLVELIGKDELVAQKLLALRAIQWVDFRDFRVGASSW